MALAIGAQLGSMEVTALIGRGGMGEVYRARDTKLKRDVAIKILPDEFSRDADRVSRFQREAEVLASLNHPNIAAIYDLQEANGSRYLVLELVEGETLADRIARRPIPVEEALDIAKNICEALEAAHEKGIIHRDLKPANIKITLDGKVKVLDFGLAKAMAGSAPATTLSNSPTLLNGTMGGAIIGTAAYMSPEQARGENTVERSDFFSFGAVLYEMLTGKQAFLGKTASDILAGVLRVEPDFTLLPQNLNPKLYELLHRCLEKHPKRRWHCAGDLLLEIDAVASDVHRHVEIAPVVPAAKARERLVWLLLLILATVTAGVLGMVAFRPSPSGSEMRLDITTPPASDLVSQAISPDGQKIVFSAISDGRPMLWLRSLDSVAARPLAGTDGGFYPFWSPDSRSVGFFASGKLQRIDLEGGLVRAVATAPNPMGGAWNRDGTILFTPNYTGPIFRVSAGGQATALTRIEGQQSGHRFPQFLPDGRHFLYYVTSRSEAAAVYVSQLDGPVNERLLDVDAPAVYAPGHLLFVRQGTLFAQAFDTAKMALSGSSIPVAEQVNIDGIAQIASLSASAAGSIAYRAGLANAQRQFVWFDRSGKELERIGAPDNAVPGGPDLSPERTRLAMWRTISGNMDVWTMDLVRGLLSRFTFNAAAECCPIWSPDGSRIVFSSDRNGIYNLYQKPAAGSGNEELLLETPNNKAPVDWSPDGRFVLYRSPGPTTGFDLWALPIQGERKPFPVVQTDFEERDGQFSPDGKWIAYQSNESGRVEVIIQPFPGPGAKVQISTNGGAQARWRRDGRELFYVALDSRLMAVPIKFGINGSSVEVGTPAPLFVTHVGGAMSLLRQQYIVSSDGQRFLMSTVTEEAPAPITVILNWRPKS